MEVSAPRALKCDLMWKRDLTGVITEDEVTLEAGGPVSHTGRWSRDGAMLL